MTVTMERYTLDAFVRGRRPVQVLWHELRDVPLHWHDFYEFVYVIDGTAEHHCNGTATTVRPGAAMLLSPTDVHAFAHPGGEPLRCLNLVIDPWFAEPPLEPLLGEDIPRGWQVADFTGGGADLLRLAEEFAGARPGGDKIVESLLTCALVEFARQVTGGTEAAPPGRRSDGLQRALFYVQQHFREPLTLAQVAAQAYLSPNYFSERFHARTGVPFQTYLQDCRLRFARSLIAATELSISEVASAAGFNSLSHFGRAYRARYGSRPSADRLAARSTPVRDLDTGRSL